MTWCSPAVTAWPRAPSHRPARCRCATATRPPEETRKKIREIRELTDKPFGINVSLLRPFSKENAEVALEEKVPIVNYALGKGDWIIKAAHEYGGKVMSTVATERHAHRAELDGVDAIVITGHEAAAHGAEPGSLVLIPQIAGLINVPLIAAGGFCDGKGLAAALALGADAISMGTRFLLARESEVHQNLKESALKATIEDTIYSEKIDGLPGRFLKTRVAEEMAKGKTPLLQAISSGLRLRKMVEVPFFKLILSGFKERGVTDLARQAVSLDTLGIAIETGDLDRGVLPLGQVAGRISDLPTCQEIIERTVAEAQEVIESIRKTIAS